MFHSNTWSSELRILSQIHEKQSSSAFQVVLEASLGRSQACFFTFSCPRYAKQFFSLCKGATCTCEAATHPPPAFPSLSKCLPWPGLFLAAFYDGKKRSIPWPKLHRKFLHVWKRGWVSLFCKAPRQHLSLLGWGDLNQGSERFFRALQRGGWPWSWPRTETFGYCLLPNVRAGTG